MPTVKWSDLELAYEFVCSSLEMNFAYVSLDTGKIYWVSDIDDDPEEDRPDDLETSDRYVAIPNRNDFDLGKRLVEDFVGQMMPDDAGHVDDIFHKRGAYGRFKNLLRRRNLLNQWHDFENKAVERNLREWCELKGIQIDDTKE